MANTCSPFSSKRFPRSVFLFLALFLTSSCSFYYSPTRVPPRIALLNPLNDWLYRGPQPEEKEFEKLKQKGIKTVVNFRDEPKWIEWEKSKVEALGMKYVNLPWNIMKPADPKLMDRFFEVLSDPKNQPVFFHCKHGRDRSGVMATLALMRYEELSETEAREVALGTIHPHLRYQPFVNQKINFFVEHLRKKNR